MGSNVRLALRLGVTRITDSAGASSYDGDKYMRVQRGLLTGANRTALNCVTEMQVCCRESLGLKAFL